MATIDLLPKNKFTIGRAISQLQGTPLTSLTFPRVAQPSVPAEVTAPQEEGIIKRVFRTYPAQQALDILKIPSTVGETIGEQLVPEKAPKFLKTAIPFTAGLATDILTPGPGGKEIKAIQKAPQLADEAVSKLVGLIKVLVKEAKPLRREIEQAYRVERGKRFGEVEKLAGGGEAGFKAQLGKLKGELIPEGERPTSLRVKGALSQQELDSLFNKIDDYIGFNTGEKVSTKSGLADLLEGRIPQPQQISHLEDVFGQDLIRSILSAKGLTVGQVIKEVFNIPRSLITSLDASGVLRQSLIQTISHPGIAIKALGKSFKDAFSPTSYKAWFDELPKDPAYRLFKDSGGYLANASKLSDVAAREERYMSRLQQIPFLRQTLGKVIGVSERAYTSYLNKLRFDSFKQVASKFIKEGLDPKVDTRAFDDLANMVNIFTGRGDLGKLGRVSEELNTAFFSPRLVASRIQALNPVWYAKQHPAVRKEAIKSLAQFAGTVMTILSLAKLNDELEVELDPRSSDFAKIKYGNTRWDIAGGFQQFIRVFAQLMFAQRKQLTTGDIIEIAGLRVLKPEKQPFTAEFRGKKEVGFPFQSQSEVISRFIRGKLAPIPNLISDLVFGANIVGEAPEVKREFIENLIPFYIQDIMKAYNELGPDALFKVGVPAFFGVGVQTFEEKGEGNAVDLLP